MTSPNPNRSTMAEAFFNSFRPLACINGHEGQFYAVNAAFTAALGWREEDLRKTAYYDLVSGADRRSLIKLGMLIIRHAGAEPRLYRRSFRHKDGSYRVIEWTTWADPATDLVFSTGRIVGVTEPR
jgi:PAS domain S-box-containing protein